MPSVLVSSENLRPRENRTDFLSAWCEDDSCNKQQVFYLKVEVIQELWTVEIIVCITLCECSVIGVCINVGIHKNKILFIITYLSIYYYKKGIFINDTITSVKLKNKTVTYLQLWTIKLKKLNSVYYKKFLQPLIFSHFTRNLIIPL